MATLASHQIKLIASRMLVVALAFLLFLPSNYSPVSANSSAKPASQASLAGMPLSFIPNDGQADPAVAFQADSPGGSLFFTANQVVVVLPRTGSSERLPVDLALRQSPELAPVSPLPATAESLPAVVRLTFDGANPTPEITGMSLLPGIANFFHGSNPANWHTQYPNLRGDRLPRAVPGRSTYCTKVRMVQEG